MAAQNANDEITLLQAKVGHIAGRAEGAKEVLYFIDIKT